MKGLHRGEKGFTLIELLLVVAIVGILATVIVPNMDSFMSSGILNAAQTEAENVKTAASGYLAEHEEWPGSSDDLGEFLDGDIKATYEFGADSGIESVSDQEWQDIYWDTDSQTWVKGEVPEPPGPAPS